jgi:hypothetical protein
MLSVCCKLFYTERIKIRSFKGREKFTVKLEAERKIYSSF